ncbi:MAG: NAD(P)-binding domain-containing protein [Lachnospiraceae bacterium]|nr:NAD(P)-binding domain-containing protein [Lachnospiraceae bacterium]
MKAILIGNRERFEKFYPDTPFANAVEKVYFSLEQARALGEIPLETQSAKKSPSGECDEGKTLAEAQPARESSAEARPAGEASAEAQPARESSAEIQSAKLLAEARDAEFLAADAIAQVPESLIAQLPFLKIIHSEGVAYNGIDCGAAARRNIYVCNNRGINADAVAEQTILLMLGLLRGVTAGDAAVRAGNQIRRKEYMMVNGIRELGECRIGLLGFGDIAKATARRLSAFGCEVCYHATRRKTPNLEAEYGVTWLESDELLETSDIISLHIPVTPETTGMVNEEFLKRMRRDAFLINTSRGEIVENAALCKALMEGWIAGAGLDTVAPEPVAADHPLLHLPAEASGRLLFSPHIGGVTTGVFRKAHRNIWTAFEQVSKGERPVNVVNGV